MHGRQSNLDYIFQVAAENSIDVGEWSSELEVSSVTSVCQAPPRMLISLQVASALATLRVLTFPNNQSLSTTHFRVELQYLVVPQR